MTVPTVSVVIPCKASERTLGGTVESLLAQDYPGLVEVIVVGDAGDSSWGAISAISDPRLVRIEHPAIAGRDCAAKRELGLALASGEYLSVVDSDIEFDGGWLSRSLKLLSSADAECVAGGMRSLERDFWGRYVDDTRLGAKTPRLSREYVLTASNFGKRRTKPAVTANLVFTRSFYRAAAPDGRWNVGYEDYEWLWRVMDTGHRVLLSDELTGLHHHRRSFGELVTEHTIAASGCAQFMKQYPSSPLARKRWIQAFLLPLAGLGAAMGAWLLLTAGLWPVVAAVAGVFLVGLMLYELTASRRLESVLYPVIAGALGTWFLLVMLVNLFVPGPDMGSATRPHQRLSEPDVSDEPAPEFLVD